MAHDSFDDEDFVVLKAVIRQFTNPLPFQAGKWQGQTEVQDLMGQSEKLKKKTIDSNNAKEVHTIYVLINTDGTAFGWHFLVFMMPENVSGAFVTVLVASHLLVARTLSRLQIYPFNGFLIWN